MLNKLLKYDLKYMITNMCVFYILALFFALTTRLLSLLEQSVMISIIGKISSGCMIAMVANIIINVMMRSWVRFRDSIYKDESYLTHTLPVTKNNIYNSKFIQTLIFYFISFIIIILSLFITYYTKENWTGITNFIKNITTGLNMSTIFFVIMFIIIVFLEIFNAIQCGFLGMIIGHRFNSNKILYSVVFGFVAYLVAQTLILILLFIFGLFDPSIMELFKTSTINIDVNVFKTLTILSTVLYLIIIFTMRFICIKLLNKGVNVE